ncbi:hypothetical protein PVAND_001887 [Polypedilum vanderplanki]|uniref:Protein kinase domain-containing protein n=1 Tax=Polypedilum vanderplanki TaxID=319348 RepID=A0A9J6BPR2_POLVA|nr:hypothetical protein PVAND_001887 [Polypedilum vanderplanki]
MVVGETQNGSMMSVDAENDEHRDQIHQQPSQISGINQATIDNIMSGIENTGAVKMNNHRKKLRQRFDIIKKLGQGTYGKVQLGINKETGQEVAIKTIKKSKIETEADLIRIRREVQIMSSVQHPNIIHIYEVFENREKMVLVMEFAAGGELYDYLSDRKVLAEEEARRIFRQVATAIYYCHKHKICHRDLKLENILLDEHGNAKIADFGLSNVFDEQRLLATFCGSPLYASPEIVKGTPYQGPEVDCWSLGVLLYTLVYGAMPFDGANFKRLVKQISQGDYFEPKNPSRASPLIREMLTVCPIRRANIEQICNHWWVNEDYNESCLDLAEELANQTPVRLDVLLSLAPPSVTSEQVVVPTHEENKERIQKSHSVGSIVEIAETEAERRILDMVAAGGEAALMPSPTRTITPQEASIQASQQQQTKRKLEPTISTENATGGAKKKEKPISELKNDSSSKQQSIPEVMEIDTESSSPSSPPSKEETKEKKVIKKKKGDDEQQAEIAKEEKVEEKAENVQDVQESLKKIEELCDELMEKTDKNNKIDEKPQKQVDVIQSTPTSTSTLGTATTTTNSSTSSSLSTFNSAPVKTPSPTAALIAQPSKVDDVKKEAIKKISSPVKRDMVKHKTSDLSNALTSLAAASKESSMTPQQTKSTVQVAANANDRKSSLPEDAGNNAPVAKPTTVEKRRSRILETAEKFQNMNNQNNEKYKKFSIPGVSVGSFKKEFERKASDASSSVSNIKKSIDTRRDLNDNNNKVPQDDKVIKSNNENSNDRPNSNASSTSKISEELNQSDSKNSVHSFSLEEARRSMENSIALLQRAKNESRSKDVDNLCAKTESFTIQQRSDSNGSNNEREKKLQAAREIIGGVIQSPNSTPTPFKTSSSRGVVPESVKVIDNSPEPQETTKTSHAEITLKSATLPRPRKPTKMEIQVEIKPKVDQSQSTKFSSEIHHQVPETLHSAPIREHPPTTYTFTLQNRSTSVEPQMREQMVNVQKPPTYQRNSSNSYRNQLSRQSTNESNDSDTTPTHSFIQSSSTIGSTSGAGDKQPIKKSPREFIIPISVEGGGIVTPKVNNLEQSESQRMSRTKRISSIFSERDAEEDGNNTTTSASVFPKLHRHTSLGRESDTEEPRFHSMHRLRSSRPTKRSTVFSQDPNESDSGDEDDDDDGFELLTAENLFSTLLSRVRALTHRLNVNNDTTSHFPSSRLMSNLRQSHSPFWNNDPFGSSRTNMHPWRTNNFARDIEKDFDSMFSRSGATLPRGKNNSNNSNISSSNGGSSNTKDNNDKNNNFKNEILDLGDLDLSQLRLTKKDLETLSSITPNLSKNIQDQLLAQLPPNQAKKLSRTLSIQNQTSSNRKSPETLQIYRRSMSNNPKSSSNIESRHSRDSITPTNEVFDSINNNTIRNVSSSSHYRRSTSRDDKLYDDSINNNNGYRERTLSPDYRKYSNRASSPSEDIERACFSPPPLSESEKKKQNHSKRFSMKTSDPIYDEPRKPELATHKILREMREKSLEKNSQLNNVSTSTINNKILDELNSISLLNNQLERFDQFEAQNKDKSLLTSSTIKAKKSSKSLSDDSQLKKSSKVTKETSSEEKTFDISNEKLSSAETKLTRPKTAKKDSNISLKSCDIKDSNTAGTTDSSSSSNGSKLERPKSFPNSKITPPKELKKLPDINHHHHHHYLLDQNGTIDEVQESNNNNADVETKKVKKVVKVVKKSTKKLSAPQIENQPTVVEVEVKREKSPEKKSSSGKGLLYTIGQKFEKLRDTKGKQKAAVVDEIKDEKTKPETILPIDMKEKKKKIKAMLNEDVDEITRQERKTKIDALIKNLKDKSTVPQHNIELTESGLIKRAVSVEEMPNTFNKNAVNKVLGLFKKIEKDNEHKSSRVQNTKSTSFLSSMDASSASSIEYYTNGDSNGHSSNNNVTRERPKSSGFVNKIKNNVGTNFEPLANICESKIPIKYSCYECKTTNPNLDNSLSSSTSSSQQAAAAATTTTSQSTVTKRHSNSDDKQQTLEERERLKNNRKGLMLDFSRFKSPEPADMKENKKANYSFPPPLPEMTQQSHHHYQRKAVTPTYDNLANYSSAATFDASISSSLSPDDVGDGWSTCSDDHATTNNSLNTGSLSLSRLSRRDSTTLLDIDAESPESVVDRIRRKSFYSRFNEKKTKRVSNIVGPAAKDYYRERSRPLEYTRSATSVIPDLLSSTSTSSSVRASSVETGSTTAAIPHHIRASSISRYTTPTSATSRSLSQTRASSTSKYSNVVGVDNVNNDTINHSSSSYRRMNNNSNNESNHLATLPPPSYHVHHHSHHHHDLPPSSFKSLSAQDDGGISTKLKSNRNTMYDSSSSSSNTPSSLYSKRRSFISSSPSSSMTTTSTSLSHHYSPSSSSMMSKPQHTFIDGYATIGRKMRQYNTRSVSLLDPNIINSSNNSSYLNDNYHRMNGTTTENNSNLSRSLRSSVPRNENI